MLKARKKIIIGNWKMYPPSVGEAKEIFAKLKKVALKQKKTDMVICPPFVFINELRRMDLARKISLGGQDVFWEERGAFTGEVSPLQLESVGATYVIVGHSERRCEGETNEIVSKKVSTALKSGLEVVLCVGESDRDSKGNYLNFLENQIKESLKGVNKKLMPKVIVAYEPVWAIGKSFKDAMAPDQFEETALFIRKVLSDLFSRDIGLGAHVLYGGSVNPVNAEGLLVKGRADGFLVGRDSLVPQNFAEIIKIAENI